VVCILFDFCVLWGIRSFRLALYFGEYARCWNSAFYYYFDCACAEMRNHSKDQRKRLKIKGKLCEGYQEKKV
jgi:hypothetical protein